ncbi:hypothetical protein NE865_06059 [Phthorimaea operculella]|nr:hypothetical protein NE865_06059 [Phthorimaea operculella]
MDPSIARESETHTRPPDLPPSASLDLLVAAAKKIENSDENRGRGLSTSSIKSFKNKKPNKNPKYVLVDPTQVLLKDNKNISLPKQVIDNSTPMDHEQIVNKDPPQHPTTEKSLTQKSVLGRFMILRTRPYIVHVQFAEENGKSGQLYIPRLFIFLIPKWNEKYHTERSKRIGRNRLSISFGSWKEANLFVLNEVLAGQRKYTASIPTFNLCRMGIVKGIPESWTHDEIIENIKVPEGYGEILRSRRMNRKTVSASGVVEWVPTQTVTLTFDGQRMPPRVFAFYSALPVQNYILPTIQCHRCCRFGHTKDKCRSRPRCSKCGEEHDAVSCGVTVFSCVNCSEDHPATAKLCPEFLRQTDIKKYMSENNESYLEASKIIPNSKTLFSEVVGRASTSNSSVPVEPTENRRVWNKKTVTISPKIKKPSAPGYDQKSHNNLIHSFKEPTPANGCGFKKPETVEKEIDPQGIKLGLEKGIRFITWGRWYSVFLYS